MTSPPHPNLKSHTARSWPTHPGQRPAPTAGTQGPELTDAKTSPHRLRRVAHTSKETTKASDAMAILLRDPAVHQLARETRRLGLAISDYKCWQLLQRIDAGGPDPLNHENHDTTDVQALALSAITQIPRPDWVNTITGLKP